MRGEAIRGYRLRGTRHYNFLVPDPVVWIAALLLAGSFGWAAIAKVLRWPSWRAALPAYRLPRRFEVPVALALPLAEGLIAVLLLVGSAELGGMISLFFLATFALAVFRAHSFQGDRLPCGCFGELKERDYRVMLARNAVLAALAALTVVGGSDEGVIFSVERPTTAEAVPGALVAAGVCLALWVARQASVSMHRREQP